MLSYHYSYCTVIIITIHVLLSRSYTSSVTITYVTFIIIHTILFFVLLSLSLFMFSQVHYLTCHLPLAHISHYTVSFTALLSLSLFMLPLVNLRVFTCPVIS